MLVEDLAEIFGNIVFNIKNEPNPLRKQIMEDILFNLTEELKELLRVDILKWCVDDCAGLHCSKCARVDLKQRIVYGLPVKLSRYNRYSLGRICFNIKMLFRPVIEIGNYTIVRRLAARLGYYFRRIYYLFIFRGFIIRDNLANMIDRNRVSLLGELEILDCKLERCWPTGIEYTGNLVNLYRKYKEVLYSSRAFHNGLKLFITECIIKFGGRRDDDKVHVYQLPVNDQTIIPQTLI